MKEKNHNIVNNTSKPSVSASVAEPGSSDEKNMVVMGSQGGKTNFCVYCKKKQQKIARHLEGVHRDEEEVKKFISLPKGDPERKKIISGIRKRGNFVFNTNKNFNDGELIVSRRPTNAANKSPLDFRACTNCKGFFSKRTLRHHFKSCSEMTIIKKKKAVETYGISRKVRWSDDEKEAIFRIFSDNLRDEILPSLHSIQSVINESPVLRKRTPPQIKTWIHNQFRKK